MKETNDQINRAYGHVEDALRLTAGRNLFSADFLSDLMLDLRKELVGIAEELGLVIEPIMPYGSETPPDDTDENTPDPDPTGPGPVAVSPPPDTL